MKIKEMLMALAIAVMAALFVGLLVDAVYPAPDYDTYCHGEGGLRPYPAKGQGVQDTCEDPSFLYREEIDACTKEKGFPDFEYDKDGCQQYASCNFCNRDYTLANKKYNRNIFFIITPVAVAGIIAGLLYTFEVAGTGFMFGGILLLVYSTGRYFSDMSKFMRVVVVFAELLLLLWIAKKKIGTKKAEKR